jgi:hypothetical protein
MGLESGCHTAESGDSGQEMQVHDSAFLNVE